MITYYCCELSRIIIRYIPYDTRRSILQGTVSKRWRLSYPANHSASGFGLGPGLTAGATQLPPAALHASRVPNFLLSVPFEEGGFAKAKTPECRSHLFRAGSPWLPLCLPRIEQLWPPPVTGVSSEADVPLPVSSPPPPGPLPHPPGQSAGPEGTFRSLGAGSDCKLNSPRSTLDSLLSSFLKRPLPGRAILPGDRCVVYIHKSPHLPRQNHSGFSITPSGIHFSPFLFHSDHALEALKSRLPL